MTVTFRMGQDWRGDRGLVRFYADVDGECVPCSITTQELCRRHGLRDDLAVSGDEAIRVFRKNRAAIEQIGNAMGYIGQLIEERRKTPRQDLVTVLATTEFEDEEGVQRRLTDDERGELRAWHESS